MEELYFVKQLIGSCGCDNKSTEAGDHHELCYFRLLMEKSEPVAEVPCSVGLCALPVKGDRVMSKDIDAGKVGTILMALAESLTVDECEITADELLENIEGRSVSVEEAGDIREWLST